MFILRLRVSQMPSDPRSVDVTPSPAYALARPTRCIVARGTWEQARECIHMYVPGYRSSAPRGA